jgi:hypothetical protein
LCRKCLLKHIIEEKIEERTEAREDEEDVSSCWMTLRKMEDPVNGKRKH